MEDKLPTPKHSTGHKKKHPSIVHTIRVYPFVSSLSKQLNSQSKSSEGGQYYYTLQLKNLKSGAGKTLENS